MIKVFRLAGDNRAYIFGVTEGPADSFFAIQMDQTVSIIRRYIGIVEVANAHFSQISDQDGNTFSNISEVMTYLAEVFTTTESAVSSAVQKTFRAVQPVTSYQLVYVSGNNDEIAVADFSDPARALPIGLSLQNGTGGDEVPVLLFGELKSANFNFPLNAPLYLGSSGSITDSKPQASPGQPFITVGTSLGAGAIFINIESTLANTSTYYDGGYY